MRSWPVFPTTSVRKHNPSRGADDGKSQPRTLICQPATTENEKHVHTLRALFSFFFLLLFSVYPFSFGIFFLKSFCLSVFFFFSFLGKARFRNVDAFLSPACYYLSFPKSRFKIAIDKSGKRRWCQNKHSEFPALPSEVNVKFCATVASREPRPPTEDKAIVLAFLRRWTQIANECYVSARLRVKLEPNVDAIIVSNPWPAFAFADDVISISRSAVRFCYLGGVGRAAAAHHFASKLVQRIKSHIWTSNPNYKPH